MNKVKTAVIGAAGYTGAELIRLLVHHPACELVCLHSNSQKGIRVDQVHRDLLGDCDLLFTDLVPTTGIDAVFLCLPSFKLLLKLIRFLLWLLNDKRGYFRPLFAL